MKMLKLVSLIAATIITAGAIHAAESRPNIMVIMVDDLGFSDPGCFGGEIETPNIDALAKDGLRFTQFYNAARCCPTRASMLTGCYQHKVGLARNGNNLSHNAVTIAEALKTVGYQTGMMGKWHLSRTKARKHEEQLKWLSHQQDFGPFSPLETYPSNRGFDEFYGVVWGVVNFFDPFSLVHNEKQIKEVPKDFYITDFINDKAVDLIDSYSKKEAPFFLYVAHTAPHWPLHAICPQHNR
jgi:arylsulfatase